MDQGITKNRLMASVRRCLPWMAALILLSVAGLGFLNIKRQKDTIANDQRLAQEMEKENASSQASPQEGSQQESVAEKRAEQNFNWSDLQVRYYDTRLDELMEINREATNYLQKSYLSQGDLFDFPVSRILLSIHAPMQPESDAGMQNETAYQYRAIESLYESDAFDQAAREALGEPDLSAIYLHELIQVKYDPTMGIVSLSAMHPDPEKAQLLAQLALKEMERKMGAIGYDTKTFHVIDESLRTEELDDVYTERRDLLRDIKTNQDELTLLIAQEPPVAQQRDTAQKTAPVVRSFSVRNLAIYLAAGFFLGLVLSAGLLVVDVLVHINRLLPEDYRADGVQALIRRANRKKAPKGVLTLKDDASVASFLKKYFVGTDPAHILLLTAEGKDEAVVASDAYELFAKGAFPVDGTMILPDAWSDVEKVVLFAPEQMHRKAYEPLKGSLLMAHQSVDCVVLLG